MHRPVETPILTADVAEEIHVEKRVIKGSVEHGTLGIGPPSDLYAPKLPVPSVICPFLAGLERGWETGGREA